MFLSILAATLPLIVLLIGIPLLMKPAAKVAPIALLVTVLAAILVFHFPAKVTVLAALQGGLTGIFPIMFIAFGFGAFLEGICGFGAPVAIPASILIGLGYNPMMAALVCLVANTGPVPFGSLAIPTVTLAKTTGLDVMKPSQMTGRFMAPLALIMAFATVYAMSKSKGMKGALGTILVSGLSFAITEFLVSNFIGADLTSVLAGLVCLVATAIYLNFQKGAQPWLFEGEAPATEERREFHAKELFLSWLPYLLLAVLVIAVNLPSTKPLFNGSAPGWKWVLLKAQIYNPGKLYAFTWLQSPGTIMLIAGIIAFPFMGISYGVMGEQFGKTFKQMIPSFIAVASILAIAEVMNLALPIIDPKTKLAVVGDLAIKQISMVATMANGIVALVSKHVYPFLSPLFGTLGVFLTGSNTSANALFGNLQKLTAQGMGLSDILMASAGSAGASAGKMISPQSIVIAATAVGLAGKEGLIMRQTIKYTIPYVILLGLMVFGFAFLFPGLVP